MQDAIPESAVVEAARAGDSAAFESLFRSHYQPVYALAYRLTGDRSEAEDVAQIVFLHVAETIRGFRGDACFRTWLYRIAVNVSRDQIGRIRTRRKALVRYADHNAANPVTPGPKSRDSSDAQTVTLAALLHLPQKERAAMVLTVCCDMTHAEAAEILTCSEGTVSWRVHRAKKKIRRFLDRIADDG